MTFAQSVGGALRAARKKAGLCQEMAADFTDKTQAWVSKVERGVTHIKLADFVDLASFYQTTPSDLLKQAQELSDE